MLFAWNDLRKPQRISGHNGRCPGRDMKLKLLEYRAFFATFGIKCIRQPWAVQVTCERCIVAFRLLLTLDAMQIVLCSVSTSFDHLLAWFGYSVRHVNVLLIDYEISEQFLLNHDRRIFLRRECKGVCSFWLVPCHPFHYFEVSSNYLTEEALCAIDKPVMTTSKTH
jgi:hypothetical protein